MITLEELLDSGVQHARRILIEDRQKSLAHFYTLVLANGEMAVIPVQWQNDIQKQLMIAGVRQVALERQAVMAMGIAEAWSLTAPDTVQGKAEGEAWMNNLPDPISQNPQRQECVMVFATYGERKIAKMLHIKRDKPGGRIVALTPNEMSGTIEGRLIDVLPRRQGAEREGV